MNRWVARSILFILANVPILIIGTQIGNIFVAYAFAVGVIVLSSILTWLVHEAIE